MAALDRYVWFENSQAGINMARVDDFVVTKTDPPTLEFRMYKKGHVITDLTDIRNFLENIGGVDELPPGLQEDSSEEIVFDGPRTAPLKNEPLVADARSTHPAPTGLE